MVDSNWVVAKSEFEKLGFYFVSEFKAKARIPQQHDVQGIYISVEIDLENYPLNQPSIQLLSICDKEELFKEIPPHWRHIDEIVFAPSINSKFIICCLHNWSAKKEHNAQFIYDRLLQWLESNVTRLWKQADDLPTWRVTPAIELSTVFIPQDIIERYNTGNFQKPMQLSFSHDRYVFTNGTESSGKKPGDTRALNDIDFRAKRYRYFPNQLDTRLAKLSQMLLAEQQDTSTFIIVPITERRSFKTTYQLLKHLSIDYQGLIPNFMAHIPIIVIYKGESGNTESLSFLVETDSFRQMRDFKIQPLRTATLPKRLPGIDLTVGVLGVGTLGSQVCRILMEKDTKHIVISDRDLLSIDNIGRHELGAFHTGRIKSIQLADFLNLKHLSEKVFAFETDFEVAEAADILIVAVGSNQSFDKLAFDKLAQYKKPILWAWFSPNNILTEIVITTPSTGCLNCYYQHTMTDAALQELNRLKDDELKKYPTTEIDVCGQPHTVSHMEKTVFVASQIVSILSYYSKHTRFKFDYVNYYWAMDEIFPYIHVGYFGKKATCFCGGS